MNAERTERITVNLTPGLLAKLDRFAELNHWSRSMAVSVLVERLEDEQ